MNDAIPENAPAVAAIADGPLPDRLSVNPKSPFHQELALERGVGIMFDGKDRTNIEEYCVSEGWVRVAAGTAKDRFGNLMTIKLKGLVAPYWRERT